LYFLGAVVAIFQEILVHLAAAAATNDVAHAQTVVGAEYAGNRLRAQNTVASLVTAPQP